jgi:hypothetical protein
MPDGWPDDLPVAELLGADIRVWDDPAVDWHSYDRVVLRSTWDDTDRFDEFVAWCRSVGDRLRNPPDTIAWNADKRYLSDLEVDTVPTHFVAPGHPMPALVGECVIKPSVSAGARDTGRFDHTADDRAQALLTRIHAAGRTAMVQPYLRSVETVGETSLVFFAGALSHALTKRAVLRPNEIAPPVEGELPVAAATLGEGTVVPSTARDDELALALAALSGVTRRFGVPTYARVDLLRGDDGRPQLVELELIEPALYLHRAPGSDARFADAVRAA